MGPVKAGLFDASQAHLSGQTADQAAPAWARGAGGVYGVNVRDIYLLLVSTFKSKGPHQRLPLLPGHPPGAWLAFGPAPLPAPPAPHPSPPPSGPEPCVSGGASENASTQLQPFSRD